MGKNSLVMLCLLLFLCTEIKASDYFGQIILQEQTDVKEIHNCFAKYKQAILNQRGVDAVLQVDSKTIKYYADMKNIALRGKEDEVRQLSTINKLMVLILRHRVEVEELNKMMPEDVFIYGVNQGWIGKNSVEKSDIGQITVNDQQASAEYIVNGKSTGLKYQFSKENNSWKMDLTSVIPASDQAFKALIRQENVNEDEFLLNLLESVSGKKVSKDIWQPLKP